LACEVFMVQKFFPGKLPMFCPVVLVVAWRKQMTD